MSKCVVQTLYIRQDFFLFFFWGGGGGGEEGNQQKEVGHSF